MHYSSQVKALFKPKDDPALFNLGWYNDGKCWTNVQPDGYYLEPLYQFSWLDRARISHKINELENGSTDPVRVYRVTLQLNLFAKRQTPDRVYPDDQK